VHMELNQRGRIDVLGKNYNKMRQTLDLIRFIRHLFGSRSPRQNPMAYALSGYWPYEKL